MPYRETAMFATDAKELADIADRVVEYMCDGMYKFVVVVVVVVVVVIIIVVVPIVVEISKFEPLKDQAGFFHVIKLSS
jgi:hypothetical protein